jgi:hypothetical protein
MAGLLCEYVMRLGIESISYPLPGGSGFIVSFSYNRFSLYNVGLHCTILRGRAQTIRPLPAK